MLRTRIITAIFLLAGLLWALFFLSREGWTAFCALLCVVAAWEWGGLAGWNEKTRSAYAVALGGICFACADSLGRSNAVGWVFMLDRTLVCLAAAFWVVVVPFWLWRKWALRSWIVALTGVVALVPPASTLAALRNIDPMMVLGILAIVWVADIAAYFSGRAFGGKKLAPNISPGKTWAGAFGAAVGVMAYGNGMMLTVLKPESGGAFEGLFENFTATLVFQLALIALTALSIIGDLFESLLKRQAGVKDSGNLLPGHGGILDRIDSLTSTLPFFGLMTLI
ncbi:MAG: phosphatidate cytidylyltransferase [Candidatus Accumulibacter sp.]|jgi:phosphatidate cytidylyltransferase|nr:phosphatidate cytidylyltransferase [Accumulibacter sp.]